MAIGKYHSIYYPTKKLVAVSNVFPLFHPPYVYKYMENEFAVELLEKGNLRLTELHDYQSNEYIADIQDESEGQKVLFQKNIAEAHSQKTINQNPVLSHLVNFEGDGKVILNVKEARVRITSHKTLAWCFSEVKNDWSMASKMNPQYDTCIEINMIPFIAKISSMLKNNHRHVLYDTDNFPLFPFTRLLKILYNGREEEYKPGHPYVPQDPDELKPKKYDYQKEWRVLWSCDEVVGNYYDVSHKGLSKYVRIVGRKTNR